MVMSVSPTVSVFVVNVVCCVSSMSSCFSEKNIVVTLYTRVPSIPAEVGLKLRCDCCSCPSSGTICPDWYYFLISMIVKSQRNLILSHIRLDLNLSIYNYS